ncbi:hypothetical protein BH10PSE19_BH10PSE19_11160 [soil metagenome]
MELKDFIKTVLIDLITGVDEAKTELSDQNGSLICAPLGPAYRTEFDMHIDAMGRYYQKVEFDVAVTASDESTMQGKAQGKAGLIKVLSISADIDGSLKYNNSMVSRVKFHVPVALKCAKITESNTA